MREFSLTPLFNKKEAELSGGQFTRGTLLRPENSSQYNTRTANAIIGMGIVQALLALLTSHVEALGWEQQGARGAAVFYSTSSRPKGLTSYLFTWDESQRSRPIYGGFGNGITYQVAMLRLLTSVLGANYGQEGCLEVATRWSNLVKCSEKLFPRNGPRGWDDIQVERMCANLLFATAIQQVADALWFAMRYQLPDTWAVRSTWLAEEQLWPNDLIQRWLRTGKPGAFLLDTSPLSLGASQRPPTPQRRLRPTRLRGQWQPGVSPEGTRERRLLAPPINWAVTDDF